MTDLNNWQEMVIKNDNYIQVPLNAYQMGNLLDAVTQSRQNGDWYNEIFDIIAVAMEKADIKELYSNSGKTFTYEEVKNKNPGVFLARRVSDDQ